METALLVVAIVIASVPAVMLTGMVFLKGYNAHAGRLAREQEQLDRKNGAAPKPQPASTANGEGRFERFTPHWPSILLVVVGVVAVYWGFQNTQVRPADAGSWGQNHWLPLLILWGMGHALVALNAKVLGTAAEMLHWLLAIVMLLLFIVLPVIGWFGGSSSNEPKSVRIAYPDASIHEMRSFPVTSAEWSPKIKAAEGQAANGMQLCISPGIKWKVGQENGTTVWQFMSVTNQAEVHYRFYSASTPCPPIP